MKLGEYGRDVQSVSIEGYLKVIDILSDRF